MKIGKMTDEKCLSKFLEMLEDRVNVTTRFLVEPSSGNITHQVLQVSCGSLVSVSKPQPLEVILRPATAPEVDALIN